LIGEEEEVPRARSSLPWNWRGKVDVDRERQRLSTVNGVGVNMRGKKIVRRGD